MPIFNTPRAGRNQEEYLKVLVERMFFDKRRIFKQGYGVVDINPAVVVASFNSIRNTYCNGTHIQVHYIEICIEKEFGIEETIRVMHSMGDYFLGQGFMAFASIIKKENFYVITFAVNSVSHLNGKAFLDNNAHYSYIYQMLKWILPADWKLNATECVFFNPAEGNGNYIHGELI